MLQINMLSLSKISSNRLRMQFNLNECIVKGPGVENDQWAQFISIKVNYYGLLCYIKCHDVNKISFKKLFMLTNGNLLAINKHDIFETSRHLVYALRK